MWRDGRPSVSRNCGCRSFARARPRSSSLRVRKGDRQSRAFDTLAVSIRKIADGRAAVGLFAGHFRFSQTLRRKFFAVPIDLPKVQTANRARDGRIHFDSANPGGTSARNFYIAARIECRSWKSEPHRGENGACSFARLQRSRPIFPESAHRNYRHADSLRAEATGSTIGATKTWIVGRHNYHTA